MSLRGRVSATRRWSRVKLSLGLHSIPFRRGHPVR